MQLGRLKKVDPRTIWVTEDMDFTPWLAQEHNISLLSETLGLELEVEAQEKQVGPFRADILCKDIGSDSWVLIENQLERTDHRHLGQLLTYSAGLKAVTIIWIASQFNDEHRATLDWLNQITDEDFQIFGLEVELWRLAGHLQPPRHAQRVCLDRCSGLRDIPFGRAGKCSHVDGYTHPARHLPPSNSGFGLRWHYDHS